MICNAPQFDWPRRVHDQMLLRDVFGHRFESTFRVRNLKTVADLNHCQDLF